MKKVLIGLAMVSLLGGCRSAYNATSANKTELMEESSIVVVRPDRYSLLGTRSMRDYLEVIYEELSTNAAGQPVVKVGLRNKGGQHWWNLKAPNFTLYAQVAFFAEPVEGRFVRGKPLYRTNRRAVVLPRGETVDVSFISPVSGARGYQVTLSEN